MMVIVPCLFLIALCLYCIGYELNGIKKILREMQSKQKKVGKE
jgi:Na+/melibiose symporter-like transporter